MKKQNKLFLILFIGFAFLFSQIEMGKENRMETKNNTNTLAYNSERTYKRNLKNLAVFIRFADSDVMVSHHLDDEKSVENALRLFNSNDLIEMESVIGSSTGKVYVPSFKKYYERESYGDLSITTEIFPKINGKVVSYTDTHPIGYYLQYNENNTIGYKDKTESLKRETELINSAILHISNMVATSGITGNDLDTNQDGIVDAISFVIEGVDGNKLPSAIQFNDLLWSHKMDNTGIANSILGKRVSSYTLLYANDYTEAAGLFSLDRGTYGTIIHEFGHMLGFMDLYRYRNDTAKPVGFYDIMGNTIGSNPQSFLTYFTSEYHSTTNWHNPLPIVEKTTENITLYKPKYIDKNEQRAIKIQIGGNPKEYFIVEYHEKKNTYSSYAAESSGILVYRINDNNKYLGNNASGNQGGKDHIYIFRPNETGVGDASGNLSQATLNMKRNKLGKELVLGSQSFERQSIFFSDGTNSGLIIEVTKETTDSITFNVIFPKMEGDGTKTNPYLIRDTKTFLYLMNTSTKNKYYKLLNDLDFKDVSYPSIQFEGNFDGNNKTIRNISAKNTGVFKTIGHFATATKIENLTIENIEIVSDSGYTLGGFANSAENVTLTNIHVKSGKVLQEKDPIYDLETTGGFIGSVENTTTIDTCSSNVEVSAKKNAGGFVGLNKNATIKNSFVLGNINGSSNIGSFIGLQLIMDATYRVPENVYYDKNSLYNAVGGYDKSFHNLNALSEKDLAKGITSISFPKEIPVAKYTNINLPVTIAPYKDLYFTVVSDNNSVVTYENNQLKGINVGNAQITISLPVGSSYMIFKRKVIVEDTKTSLTEDEVMNYLGLTKKSNYVSGFSLGTNIKEIQQKIMAEPRIQFQHFTNENNIPIKDGLIATGMKLTIAMNQIQYTYTIVVKGDVNGDGLIYATDYVKIKNHIMGKTKLSGAYLMASDINNDGKIYATDYVLVKNHIMGKSSIVQKL